MLAIKRFDHVGVRIADREASVDFYRGLGFELVADAGYDQGHPIILRHPSGVVLNLLGPATDSEPRNVLMDVPEKHAGYTHIALEVGSLTDAKALLAERGIEITGSFSFGKLSAIFVRDPDRNVIELDYHGSAESEGPEDGYLNHP